MPNRPRHVYVHVPFCGRRCSYCDFSIAVRRVTPVDEYTSALKREIDLRFPDRDAWPVDTLYFGGGTPSRLGGEGLARAIETLRSRLTLEPNAELTIEANPEDITPENSFAWREAGVNRISIGSQSFDNGVLTWMHRTHDATAIERSVDVARAAGIENISLDLIFALPETVARSWERDVARALALQPSHLSLYGLTIEPQTPLGRWHSRGDIIESADENYEREFLHAHDVLSAAGYVHYEVSNFGKRGRHSRHNSSYWAGVPYAGLGPSAHEFDGSVRRWNASAYSDWVSRLAEKRDPVDSSETLDAQNCIAETVYLGLRTIGGLELLPKELSNAQPWIDAGWAVFEVPSRIVLTALGWLRLDAIAAALTHIRSRY